MFDSKTKEKAKTAIRIIRHTLDNYKKNKVKYMPTRAQELIQPYIDQMVKDGVIIEVAFREDGTYSIKIEEQPTPNTTLQSRLRENNV